MTASNSGDGSVARSVCAVCGTDVSWMDMRCAGCGAVTRDRVPSLDLFHTMFLMLEDPRAAWMRISRSEQKNYVLLLSMLAGPLLSAVSLFAAGGESRHVSFVDAFLFISVTGPCAGLLYWGAASMLSRAALSHMHVVMRPRLTSALTAWSSAPLAAGSVCVLPLLLGLCGAELFQWDPGPWTLTPLPFWALSGLAACLIGLALVAVYSAYSLHVAHRGRLLTVLGLHGLCMACITGVFALLASPFSSLIV